MKLTPNSIATIGRAKKLLSATLCVFPVRHTDCSEMAENEAVTIKIEPVWQDSEENEACKGSFDFVSVPAEPCPSQVDVMVKVKSEEPKTEPVSPQALNTNSDEEYKQPLSCVETVMVEGEVKNGVPAEKKNQDIETTKTAQGTNLKDNKIVKIHECKICERRFKARGALNEHFRTHSGEKPYECNICNYKFTKKINLDIHLRTHTGEKPFECELCKRKFNEAVNLKRHVRTHTGEKPYECDVCKRRFNEAVNLKTHQRTHTGEKPFHCPYSPCDNRFSQKVTLERHMRTHTGEKPFECNICHAKFLASSGLSRHRRTHNGGKHSDFTATCDMKKTYKEEKLC